MVQARQVREEHRAVHAGRTGVVQDGLLVVAPALSHPERHLVATARGTTGRKLEGELAGLLRVALLQGDGLERLLGRLAEQLRTPGIDALIIVKDGRTTTV